MSLLKKHKLIKRDQQQKEIEKLKKENEALREGFYIAGEYIEYISNFRYSIRASDYKKIQIKSEETARKIGALLG